MEVTIAVASDFHCHHSSMVPAETMLLSDADRQPSSHHPVEALLDLIRDQKITAEILAMPGDITNKTDRQGIISGWDFIRQIGVALNTRLIAPTLGNHDVKSRDPSGDPFAAARALMPEFPLSEQTALKDFWANGFCIIDSRDIRVALINSVASHTTKEAADHGLITPQQLAVLNTALAGKSTLPFQIAICHHHPMLHEDIGLGTKDVIENGSLLIDLLAAHGFHLVIHGHKHHPKLSYAPGAVPLPVLASGSFAAGMKHGLASRTRNLFHLIKLHTSGPPGLLVKGTIDTWQFRLSKGWVPASWVSADFPFRTGFGCCDPPQTIADKLHTTFQALSTDLARWSAVSSQIEEIPYLIPSTFEQVGIALHRMGLDLYPATPDQPDIIGTATE
jgi:hypothetical protein